MLDGEQVLEILSKMPTDERKACRLLLFDRECVRNTLLWREDYDGADFVDGLTVDELNSVLEDSVVAAYDADCQRDQGFMEDVDQRMMAAVNKLRKENHDAR